MTQSRSVAIAGAGIAGLTAALSFARKGFATDIFERAPALSEVGAGLQLSPNATRILDRLGLLSQLERAWSEPTSIDLVSGTSLRALASVPSGPFARHRWAAPYGVLHRADLQRVLLDAVKAEPLCRLHLGAPIETSGDLPSADRPRLTIGADGVWSAMRNRVQGSGNARFSGNIAWRLTLREADAPTIFDVSKVTAYLGPGCHLVVYPLRKSGRFNLVAITAGHDTAEPADTSLADVRAKLLAAFEGWHPRLLDCLKGAVEPTIWPLNEVSDGAWHQGESIVLIGDAAHAMMPFAAQGAAMAIEDGFELAAFVADGQPLAAFAAHRKRRIARVRARGDFNRFAYHARGPIRLGRDLVLSMRRPESLAADFDWLYGYQPRD
ncbi:FAD-dependent monooxygenase [Rhizobium sp. Root482]|uniref:FAD-dependent monooxygenase n=1 Tax=Rhizobium sp. Root482 TaxID=1736543 RepID=UPI0006FF6CD1|nr:FAD-dependent monooxygenase [Rhizobium sp. Root482]KQY14576.1 salicylate hydroxylase [Rhizobium sp. Root482]